MNRIIPVVVVKSVEETLPIMQGLKDRGIEYAEITFRTECAAEAIKIAAQNFPEMMVGAGTVINAQQCRQALDAGAKFIVSPGLSEEVFEVCSISGVPYYPGCVTPTEIMKAISLGLSTLKFFPASVYGGIKALKALSGPFPQVKWIPTGGIDRSNLDEYLAFDKVFAVGGSFIVEEIKKEGKK